MRDACGQAAGCGQLFRAPQGLLCFTRLGGVAAVKNDSFAGLRIDVELEPCFVSGDWEELLEFDSNAVFHAAADVRFDVGADQVGIQIPQAGPHVRPAGVRGKLQSGGIHVGDAIFAVHGAECDGNVLQCFAGHLARAVDLLSQSNLLFRGFATHARHLQLRFDARNEFAGSEGLGEVVVSACFDAFDAGLLSGARREHDDGDGGGCRILAQGGEKREPIHLRHHHVGQDEIGAVPANFFERARPLLVATTSKRPTSRERTYSRMSALSSTRRTTGLSIC